MLEIIFGVAGGLAIFLYGMTTCSEGLQKASGSALKRLIHRLTSNPVMGVVVGAIVTVLIQSSSATTVILVGLVGASLMTLKQSIGVILGADVGTTLTVQLIAFNVTQYALLMVAVGFGVRFLSKRKKTRHIGQIIFGFGMIFFGMGLMSQAMEPLKYYPGAEELFLSLGTNPFLGLLLATAFTALIQGSAATIGIVLSLSTQGLIPLQAAIPLILGANIGTCATAMLSTIGAPCEAKRVGIAHVLFKVLGVIIIFPFIGPFTQAVSLTSASVTRQIANAHTLFNVGITVMFLPFAAQLAKLVERLVPEKSEKLALGKPQFLDRRNLDSPLVALEQARAEVTRVAELIEKMTGNVGTLIKKDSEVIYKDIIAMEEAVDSLYQEVIEYLSDIAQHDLSQDESEANLLLIQVINDLEHIGDVLVRMSSTISNKIHQGVHLSPTGHHELEDFHQVVHGLVATMVKVLQSRDVQEINALLEQTKRAVTMENSLRLSHIRRIQAQVTVTKESSSVHLDLINGMRRIAEHITLIGRNVAISLGETEKYNQAFEMEMQRSTSEPLDGTVSP